MDGIALNTNRNDLLVDTLLSYISDVAKCAVPLQFIHNCLFKRGLSSDSSQGPINVHSAILSKMIRT